MDFSVPDQPTARIPYQQPFSLGQAPTVQSPDLIEPGRMEALGMARGAQMAEDAEILRKSGEAARDRAILQYLSTKYNLHSSEELAKLEKDPEFGKLSDAAQGKLTERKYGMATKAAQFDEVMAKLGPAERTAARVKLDTGVEDLKYIMDSFKNSKTPGEHEGKKKAYIEDMKGKLDSLGRRIYPEAMIADLARLTDAQLETRYSQLEAVQSRLKKATDLKKEEAEISYKRAQEQELGARSIRELAQAKRDTVLAERALRGGGEGEEKAPAGYRRSKTKPGELEFIPGGPADPEKKAGQLSNRESVFINRVMLSANEAAKDLENVVNLPLSASTGWLGLGSGKPAPITLFGATSDVLKNKMTSQEVQSYNTKSAGFQRSLAAIESAGLAPSGTLSHQMDAVIFKEGDTNQTKLEKLAQTRQIVEAGLETTLANPRLPQAGRDHIEEVLKTIHRAVPFTHRELDELRVAQETNPEVTLKDLLAKKKKEAVGVKAAKTAGYTDPVKEAEYQAWKAAQGK